MLSNDAKQNVNFSRFEKQNSRNSQIVSKWVSTERDHHLVWPPEVEWSGFIWNHTSRSDMSSQNRWYCYSFKFFLQHRNCSSRSHVLFVWIDGSLFHFVSCDRLFSVPYQYAILDKRKVSPRRKPSNCTWLRWPDRIHDNSFLHLTNTTLLMMTLIVVPKGFFVLSHWSVYTERNNISWVSISIVLFFSFLNVITTCLEAFWIELSAVFINATSKNRPKVFYGIQIRRKCWSLENLFFLS